MPVGASKLGVLGAGLVPGGSVTFNTSGNWPVPPGVKKVSITGRGGTGNPGNAGNPGNPGNQGTGGGGGAGGGGTVPNCPSTTAQNNRRQGGVAFKNFVPGGPQGGQGFLIPDPTPALNPSCFFTRGGVFTCPAPCKINGDTGISGNAGSAGNAGNPGNSGQQSSGLGNTFPGGAGGNAGVAGAAGNGGTGGTGGQAGNFTCPGPVNPNTVLGGNGGSGGNGGGSGGRGPLSITQEGSPFSTVPNPYTIEGGGGGGGAGTTNSGQCGQVGKFVREKPAPSPPASLGNLAPRVPFLTAAGGGFGGCVNAPYPTGCPGFSVNPGPTSTMGGSGNSSSPGQGSASIIMRYRICAPGIPNNPRANRTGFNPSCATPATFNSIFRAGGGGAAGRCGGPIPANSNPQHRAGGGGGGGGRGNAGNAGGTSPTPTGSAGTPATFNCVTVTPGSTTPIVVASPGGQIVISWNPQ